MRRTILLAAMIAVLGTGTLGAQTKLLRFPDIHGDRVAFCYGGDLWTAPVAGGTAARLTAHPGQELFPEVLARRAVDRLHRPVRRRRAGLRHPVRGRACRSGSPGTRPAARCRRAGGYDNQVYGWTPDGTEDPLPLAARRRGHQGGDRALHGRRGRRAAGEAADAHGRRRGLLPRREAHRLLAALPRLPHLEALRGGLGAGPLRLRPGQPRDPRRSSPSRSGPSATRCGSGTRSTSSPTATGR